MSEQDIENEIASIRSLAEEIIETVARIHPSNLRPNLGSFPPSEVPDNLRVIPGCNFSIPLTFDDGTEWVIRFPLKTRTAFALMNRKILSEIATIKWLKRNTSIPCPTIHAFDADGNGEWNSTGLHCLIMDRIKGRALRNLEWRNLPSPQRDKVLRQIASIMVELGSHHFDGIGSPVEHPDGTIGLGPLAELTCNEYCVITGHPEFFLGPFPPYPTVMEYSIALANMRLIYEALQVPVLSDTFTDMWLFRSLLPSLVLPEYNRGPFILKNGRLRREIVFFDDNYQLTGIINWEWSRTVPIQGATISPHFITIPPVWPVSPAELKWHQKIEQSYAEHVRQVEMTLATPQIQTDLRKQEVNQWGTALKAVDYVLSGGLNQLSDTFWTAIFGPFFGNVDRVQFMRICKSAPGVMSEFSRIKAFIQQRDTSMP